MHIYSVEVGTNGKFIKNALDYISAMRVDHDNQELAVAAKQELRKALEAVKHEYTAENK